MKKLFTLFALLLFAAGAFAQNSFAPKGAEWYYDVASGVIHSYLVADTTVSGKICKHIKMESGVTSVMAANGFYYYKLPDYLVYNSGDTTFVYNNYFGKFTPLYIFNVAAGDTVTLPVIPPSPGKGDSTTFRFVVDSVKMVKYDTSMLKTVYTSPIPDPASQKKYTYFAYAERIGKVYSGLVPSCNGCGVPLDARIPYVGDLRCYHDSTYAIKLVTDDCSKGISVGIKEAGDIGNNTISLYPNPATDKLTISGNLTDGKPYTIAITDITGRTVNTETITATNGKIQLSLSAMAKGVYTLKIHNAETIIAWQKLVINN